IPSILTWKEKGISLVQTTQFPFEEKSRMILQLPKPASFAINFRYPSWVKAGQMKLAVNGKAVPVKKTSSSYVRLLRLWKAGDRIAITLPMRTKVEYLPDSSSWASVVHGPIVLAAATDTTDLVGLRADGSRMGHVANGPSYPIEDAPVILSEKKDFASAITQVKDEPFAFKATSLIYPAKYQNLTLVPFFQIHDARYMIYWPVATKAKLEERQKAVHEQEQAKLALEKQTVDQVAPGEQQPESDHNFKGENTESGVFNDRHWRHAAGWFSYDLKNPNKEARKLRVTYFGGDKGRTFDIFINGSLLQTVTSNDSLGNKFYDVDYEIPDGLAEKIMTVKFVAHPQSVAGGVFDVRLLK
ncbi:MAG TPA: DUF6805 domain-containing protein, partial [Segetibacter sp.]|nr:DUF6805 domain-containing protein [Segetibacter sp.]